MLQPPEGDEPLTVLGIDPGTSTLGVSIMTWAGNRPVYDAINAFTLNADATLGRHQAIADYHGSRTGRIYTHREHLLNLLWRINPHVVVMESPFLRKGRAQSFEALVECRAMIRACVIEFDPNRPLYEFEPRTVKVTAGVELTGPNRHANAKNKELVRTCLKRQPDIQWGFDIDLVDEHAVDATAVAYHYLKVT